MDKLDVGDLVVLISGSMRMAVEAVDGDQVACVWCHEGEIGRDAFHARLLKRWEYREEEPARAARGKPQGEGGRAREDKPKPRTGWDGKPREKKFFRKG